VVGRGTFVEVLVDIRGDYRGWQRKHDLRQNELTKTHEFKGGRRGQWVLLAGETTKPNASRGAEKHVTLVRDLNSVSCEFEQ
jgi:hypothetical protein